MKKSIKLIDKYFNLANYLCVAQMYLKSNITLKETLSFEHIKDKVSGHFGNVSQINFIYSHLNYFCSKNNIDAGLIIGSGHAGLPLITNQYLEGTIKDTSLENFVSKFGTEDGVRSEINPEYIGTIYDGGELGYALGVSFGAVLNSKNIVFCVIGDGEMETGTTSSSFVLNKFLNYKKDGIVIPIINMNNFKMGGTSIYSSFNKDDLSKYFKSIGYNPYFVDFNHEKMINSLDKISKDICNYFNGKLRQFPLIVLNIPKGFTAPEYLGFNFANTSQSHKNPLNNIKQDGNQLKYLEYWLKSYKINKYFNSNREINIDFSSILPHKRISEYFINHTIHKEQLSNLSKYLQNANSMDSVDKYIENCLASNYITLLSPDELISNKFKNSQKQANSYEILNENICECLMEGQTRLGNNCLLCSYESFMPIISSQFDQNCKFISENEKLQEPRIMSSQNYLLTSVCWENCYSHQNPSFISNALNKPHDFIDVYFPADYTSTIITLDNCFKTNNKINIIVKSKHIKAPTLTIDQANDLVTNNYLYLKFTKSADATIIVMGDALINNCNNVIDELTKRNPILKVNLIYLYNIKALTNLTNKEFLDFIGTKKKLVFIFHGYPDSIRNLLFEKAKLLDIQVLGFQDQCSKGGLNSKLVVNNIDTRSIINAVINNTK